MDLIKNYIESMFSKVEDSPKVRHLKDEILANMTEKYQDLIDQGCNSNEALGKVISEFGDVDELIKGYHLNSDTKQSIRSFPILADEVIKDFILLQDKSYLLTSLGVFLIIASSVFYTTGYAFFGSYTLLVTSIGILVNIVSLVIAIGLFITAGRYSKEAKQYILAPYSLTPEQTTYLKQELKMVEDKKQLTTMLAIGLILFPIVPLIIPFGNFLSEFFIILSVGLLITGLAAGIFLFIYFGNKPTPYKVLLKKGLSSQASNEEVLDFQRKKKISILLENSYWPLVVIVYLVYSYKSGNWHMSWILFILAAAIEGAIKAFFQIEDDEED